jgi:protein TonB
MALSNLISEQLEQYGGVDLKKNQNRYFSNALGISIGLHLLLVLIYVGWSWFSTADERRPIPQVHSVMDLAPPPSLDNEDVQPVTPPPPSNVVKPNLGVPIPVPDAIAPQLTLPDMNQPTPQAVVGNGPVTSNAPTELHIAAPVKEEAPGIDDFVSVDKEPQAIQAIDKLAVYPEVARRSGLEGSVVLRALIGTDGRVDSVVIEKSDYDLFKNAAIDAMKKARYTPAIQNGNPIRVWTDEKIDFKLK